MSSHLKSAQSFASHARHARDAVVGGRTHFKVAGPDSGFPHQRQVLKIIFMAFRILFQKFIGLGNLSIFNEEINKDAIYREAREFLYARLKQPDFTLRLNAITGKL